MKKFLYPASKLFAAFKIINLQLLSFLQYLANLASICFFQMKKDLKKSNVLVN